MLLGKLFGRHMICSARKVGYGIHNYTLEVSLRTLSSIKVYKLNYFWLEIVLRSWGKSWNRYVKFEKPRIFHFFDHFSSHADWKMGPQEGIGRSQHEKMNRWEVRLRVKRDNPEFQQTGMIFFLFSCPIISIFPPFFFTLPFRLDSQVLEEGQLPLPQRMPSWTQFQNEL